MNKNENSVNMQAVMNAINSMNLYQLRSTSEYIRGMLEEKAIRHRIAIIEAIDAAIDDGFTVDFIYRDEEDCFHIVNDDYECNIN